MSTAVITIVSGRHDHLRNQQRGLLSGTELPEHYIVVGMDDAESLRLTAAGPLSGSACRIHLLDVPVDRGLPLAKARNAGARAALTAGADILIFLDIDCVPSPSLTSTYTKAVAAEPVSQVHCGVVRYLDAVTDAGRIHPGALVGTAHPARPELTDGESAISTDWWLFWSLSFAVSAGTWSRLGGFCEDYSGYGAEDTDLGYRAHLEKVPLQWLGGADAFHQHHDSEQPPVRHLHDIIDNAAVFHRRWGFWPMQGWLTAFREAGLAAYDEASDRWRAL